MVQTPTSSAAVSVSSYTERAQRHKDGSVLLSIRDDRICKLNGVGALTWMILEENPAGLNVAEVVRELSEQFDSINAEGKLKYEVSRAQLQDDTARFLKQIAEMNLLQIQTDSRGEELYRIKEGVSGTTSSTVAATAAAKRWERLPEHVCGVSTRGETHRSIETKHSVSTEQDIRPLKRETFAALLGLLAFDLLLKFGGFQSLIKKVQHWPIAEPRTIDPETCRRVQAMVDRAQMYYPKKAMCLQHSAVVTCLLRRCGVPAEMVLAAQEFPPKGHAWVEVEGEVINDRQVVKEDHRVLKRI